MLKSILRYHRNVCVFARLPAGRYSIILSYEKNKNESFVKYSKNLLVDEKKDEIFEIKDRNFSVKIE